MDMNKNWLNSDHPLDPVEECGTADERRISMLRNEVGQWKAAATEAVNALKESNGVISDLMRDLDAAQLSVTGWMETVASRDEDIASLERDIDEEGECYDALYRDYGLVTASWSDLKKECLRLANEIEQGFDSGKRTISASGLATYLRGAVGV